MENARRFLEHQISSYEQQLRAAEKRRADFRAKYIDILPGDPEPRRSPTLGDRRGDAESVHDLDGKLQDAIIQRDTLRQELANTPPMLVVEAGGMNAAGQPVSARQDPGAGGRRPAEDAAAQGHRPASGRDRAEEADRGAEGFAAIVPHRRPVKPVAREPMPRRAPRNRGALGAQSGLRAAQGEAGRGGHRRQFAAAAAGAARRATAIGWRRCSASSPACWPNIQNMDRDYGVLRRNYEELLGRLQSANIAQAADTQADKVKLQIVDPPEVPRLPAAPNRLLLVSGVLLAGLGGGVAHPHPAWPARPLVLHGRRPAQPRAAGARRHFRPGSAAGLPAPDDRRCDSVPRFWPWWSYTGD